MKPFTQPASPAWTRSRLDKERGDWWDTQVTGSQEIWGAVRLAAQYLQKGELQEAQTLLDATGCTCPTGLLWRGVYDPTGVQYKVPEWVVVEPEGLAEEGAVDDGKATSSDDAEGGVGAAVDDQVRVRVRTSHDQRDVSLLIAKRDSVGVIVEKLKEEAKVCLVSSRHVLHPLQRLTIYSSIPPLESDSFTVAAYTTTMRRSMRCPAGTLTTTLFSRHLCRCSTNAFLHMRLLDF